MAGLAWAKAEILLDLSVDLELGWVAGILQGCVEDLGWARAGIRLVREVVLAPGWAVAPLGHAAVQEVELLA